MQKIIRRLLLLTVVLFFPRAACGQMIVSHPCIAFSPDGRRVAACAGWYISVFAMADGHRVARMKIRQRTTGVAFSPDGRRLAVGALGQRIFIFDVASHRLLETMHRGGLTQAGGYSLAFAAGGSTLITAGTPSDRQIFDRSVRFWSVRSRRIRASVGTAYDIRLSAGGTLAALSTLQNPPALLLVDAATGRVARRIAAAWLPEGGFGPRGRHLTYVDEKRNEAVQLDLATGRRRRLAPARGLMSAVITRGFRDLALGDDKTMRVYSLPVGRLEARFACASPARVGAGDGLVAAEETWNGRIRIWRAATGRLVATVPSGDYADSPHDDSEWTFDPAGRRLVILDDKMLGRWGRTALRAANAATGRVLWTKAIGP